MTESLTPDELGDVGESLFRKLCGQAKLICNKSDRDRTGWDFRVEFPFDAQVGIPLDQRTPRSCLVQLKSTAAESGTRVSASLSSIERLAKDVYPAVVVVFRLRPDGSELQGYAIHLLNDELSRILHRLRRAEADGRADVNHLKITFDYLRGQRFKLTAEGLRGALEKLCGPNPSCYTEVKRNQLVTLGYEDGGGVEADALVWIENRQHFIRMMTGLSPIRPEKITAYDRRFDVRIPYKGTAFDGMNEFTIELPPAGPCEITVRNGPLHAAAFFRCQGYVPPPIEGGPLLVMRHPALSFLFGSEGLEIETPGVFATNILELDQWVLLLRALTYLASGSATIEVEYRETRLPPISVDENGLAGPDIENLPLLLEFVERWRTVLENVGTVSAQAFSVRDIWAASAVGMSLDIILNPTPLARLEVDAVEGVMEDESVEALYYNNIQFAGTVLSFATRAYLRRSSDRGGSYASTGFKLLDIRRGVADLDAYAAEIATAHEVTIVMQPGNMSFEGQNDR